MRDPEIWSRFSQPTEVDVFASGFAVTEKTSAYLKNEPLRNQAGNPSVSARSCHGLEIRSLNMALFKFAKRPKTHQTLEGAELALYGLSRLCGEWHGRRRITDPDTGRSLEQDARIEAEISPEGTHLIINYEFSGNGPLRRSFDVYGLDQRGDELAQTHFSGRKRHTQIFDVEEITGGDPKHAFSLTLGTVGWDEARPSEMKIEFEFSDRALSITSSRRLINSDDHFEAVSKQRLVRSR